MTWFRRSISTIVLLLAAVAVFAAGGIDGKWRGTSICTIRDSPCHDEQVVYTVSKPDSAGKHMIQMDKVVAGKQELMGTLNCVFDKAASTISCPMKDKVWKFTVSGNNMTGTLTLDDGRLYRNISVTKD
jgi:hypothetical protein